MPTAFAVLRLISSSNFVGCSTGRSPGLVPLIGRGPWIEIDVVGAVGDQGAGRGRGPEREDRGQSARGGRLDQSAALEERERARLDDDHRRAGLPEPGHRLVDLGDVGHRAGPELDVERLGRLLGALEPVLPVRPARVPEVVNHPLRLPHLEGELHVLAAELGQEIPEPGDVPARTREALDEPDAQRVADADEEDRGRRGLALHRHRRGRPHRDQQLCPALHEAHHRLRDLELVVGPHHLEHEVAVLDDPRFTQALSKRLHE